MNKDVLTRFISKYHLSGNINTAFGETTIVLYQHDSFQVINHYLEMLVWMSLMLKILKWEYIIQTNYHHYLV